MFLKDYNWNIYLANVIGLLIYGILTRKAYSTIIENPRDTVVLEGNSTILNCVVTIENASQSQCSWTKGNVPIQIDKSAGKYAFVGDPSIGQCGLQIFNASIEKDDDVWKCSVPIAGASEGGISSPAKLTVLVTPTSPVLFDEGIPIPSGGNISIKENVTEKITCTSRYGNPVPNLMFSLNNKVVTPTDDAIDPEPLRPKTYQRTISYQRSFDKDVSGQQLICYLKHSTLQTPQFVETTISVTYSTTSVELLIPEYVIVDYGTSYTFSCRADGNPAPAYEWLFQSGTSKSQIVSTLSDYVLESAQNNNVGTYTCLAGNDGVHLLPTPEITFDIRSTSITTAGIVGIVFGVIFIVAIAILVFLVIHLRKRLRNRNKLVALPNLPALDGTPPLRHNNTYHNRSTYMVPFPTEMAPLRPGSGESFDRKDGSHIYMEPHVYENKESSRPPPRSSPPPIPKTPPPPTRIQRLPSYLELQGDSSA